MLYTISLGVDDLDCGPHLLTFERGTVTASVNISVVNDDIPECDRTFIAHIIIGNGGNSTGQGFRLSEPYSAEVKIVDDGMHRVMHVPMGSFLLTAAC